MSAAPRNLLMALASSEPMREVYNDAELIAAMTRFELALAESEAELGIIPAHAVEALRATLATDWVDFERIAGDAPNAGNLAIPLVKQLTAAVAASNAAAAVFVHWGATSQDVIDTASMLQARAAIAVLLDDVDATLQGLALLAQRTSGIAMPGRTWLQHATPVSVGLKAAGWLDALLDIKDRLVDIDARLPLQFGGASGTLAALGTRGDEVSDALAARLKLRRPLLPWHAARIPIAELGAAVGMLIGVLGKAARDIALLMQTEVGELSEPSAPGKGGSSTMAHKRNPVGCAIALAAAQRAPGLVATLLGAMVQEQERGLGGWQAEWVVLPELMLLAGGSTHAMRAVLCGLEINEKKLAANLALESGLSMAEAATFALAETFGRLRAQQLISEAIVRVRATPGTSLGAALLSIDEVHEKLEPSALDVILDPANYLGSAAAMIERVLMRYHQGLSAI